MSQYLLGSIIFLSAGLIFAAEKAIPFKEDNINISSTVFKMLLFIIVLAILTYGVRILLKKYQYKIGSGVNQKSYSVTSMTRINAKLTLYHITTFDKNEIILAQSDTTVVVLDKRALPG